jgi:pyoverdine/dityrosine biosynthesis protein Dit1
MVGLQNGICQGLHLLTLLTDLLSISDRDTWAYGQAIRAMVVQKGFTNISFSRLHDLVSLPLPDKLEEITYVANAMNFRRCIFNQFGKDDIAIDHEIATNPDTKLTYLGYRRFLESDLKHIFPLGDGRSNKGYKRDVKYLAKQMLIRGYVSLDCIITAACVMFKANDVIPRPLLEL